MTGSVGALDGGLLLKNLPSLAAADVGAGTLESIVGVRSEGALGGG